LTAEKYTIDVRADTLRWSRKIFSDSWSFLNERGFWNSSFTCNFI